MARLSMERSGEMEVFVRTVEEGGFSRAARSLDLTPSAVSKLISRLERRLGARLFNRTTRALQLTDEGEVFFQSAVRLVEELNRAEQAVADGTVRGKLKVNSSIPFGRMFIAPLIPLFLKKNPGVTIDFSLSDSVIDLVQERADVAIRTGTLADSGLKARKLATYRRVVCASPAYLKKHGTPETPSDLKNHECITLNFRSWKSGWPFKERGREYSLPVAGNLLVNNGETLKEMALAGVGISRLGVFHVEEEIRSGKLVPILEKYNAGDIETISAVYLGGAHLPPRVRAFIDHLVENLKI